MYDFRLFSVIESAMRVGATEEYGLRCILQLAYHQESVASAGEISFREGISVEYVSKLMQFFRKAGLVRSIRGSGGGFVLSKKAENITLFDVFQALPREKTFSDMKEFCGHYTGVHKNCVHLSNCGVQSLWGHLFNHFYGVLKELSLADVRDRKKIGEKLRAFGIGQKIEKSSVSKRKELCL